ncbi:MAG TPA: histidine kinase [Candidatus Binataceae bacterium]|jgi:signal transduction histidine kinase|nr:histidine kinase [Candidatus Binataceae bacterium]
MRQPDFKDLDLNVARARVLLSLLAMLSLYIDPTVAGGPFHLNGLALAALLCHLAYSLALYVALSRHIALDRLPVLSTAMDLVFATVVAFLTEGQTSPSYVFFVFAIIAVGVRKGLRRSIELTLCSVTLYLAVISVSDRMTSFYVMRAVYLAIAGYLIGVVGQARGEFEERMHEIEVNAERHSIARSLHDGYIQALAGVNLRLETCRQLLRMGRAEDALAQLTELQVGVAREYDEVRDYIRSLAGVRVSNSRDLPPAIRDPRLRIQAAFNTDCLGGEQILQIMLEGLRNARRHAMATLVTINVWEAADKVQITIDDDGVGFDDSAKPPWAIASRVAEFGGFLSLNGSGLARLAIEIPKS